VNIFIECAHLMKKVVPKSKPCVLFEGKNSNLKNLIGLMKLKLITTSDLKKSWMLNVCLRKFQDKYEDIILSIISLRKDDLLLIN
jgi:hypothetical protein